MLPLILPEKKKSQNGFGQGSVIQPKLRIGQPGDKYEREADAIADRVMNLGPAETVQMQPMEEEEELIHPKLRMQPKEEEEEAVQMKCAECGEEQMVQAKSDSGGAYTTPVFSQNIQKSKGSGRNLSGYTNQFMSNAIGSDFSRVQIHTGSDSVKMNKQLGARAFTHRNNIYFNSGEYNPDNSKGKRLLAHELTHVVQQNSNYPIERIQKAPDADPLKDWEAPTSGVVNAWMYNQIDNWHTGATQGLAFFKDAILEESSVGFWLGLAGNLVWAIGALGAPLVATGVGLTGVMIGAIGSKVQAGRDQKASDTVSSIYEDYLSGFNDARSLMSSKVISETTRIMKLPDFNKALLEKDHAKWQQFVKSEANLPEGTDVNMIRKNVEQSLYLIYLKDKGAYISKSNFTVPSPNYPGGTVESRHIYPHNIPAKVLKRLEKLGVDWRYMIFLEIPQRVKDLVRKEGTVGAIEYWNYTEGTIFPSNWTQADKDDFYKKVPSWMAKTDSGTTY